MRTKEQKKIRALRQRELKKEAISVEKIRRGGCQWPGCSRNKSLHWHHRNPAAKKFHLGSQYCNWSRTAIQLEMSKCWLLCKGHHQLVEAYITLSIKLPKMRKA
jgi:hypothetical protein